jgi:ABC-2 type transport system ATP-binding protein
MQSTNGHASTRTNAIEVSELYKRFGDFTAVDGISFEVRSGEIFGFLGPNGAGKTTTISMLCTLLRPTAGHATIGGYDVARQPSEVRREIGIVFQDTTLDDRLTARENLYFHGEVYGMSRGDIVTRAADVLERVGLTDRAREPVLTFSGGMKRRLEIARGLMHSPTALFLDEPTVGLDVETRRAFWAQVRELVERGKTVVLTTHYLEEADALSDRIVVLHHGRVRADGTPYQIKSQTAARRIRCVTNVAPDTISRFPGVRSARYDKASVEVLAVAAEPVLRELFARDPDLRDLEVTGAGIEDAFLSLTGDHQEPVEAA